MFVFEYGGENMSRPRKMTTEQMIEVVDSYYMARAECNEKLLKCSLIANYAIELGYSAAGYDFARNLEVREHIERMKCYAEVQAEECHNEKVSLSYKSLDISGFIRVNNDNMKLTKALNELDAYWKSIYENAKKIAAQNRELIKKESGYETQLSNAGNIQKKLQSEKAELSKLNNALIHENRYLRKMLRTYLYPAIANEILLKENVIKEADTEATAAAVRQMTELGNPKSLKESIAEDLKVQSEEENLLKKMWEMCDE